MLCICANIDRLGFPGEKSKVMDGVVSVGLVIRLLFLRRLGDRSDLDYMRFVSCCFFSFP